MNKTPAFAGDYTQRGGIGIMGEKLLPVQEPFLRVAAAASGSARVVGDTRVASVAIRAAKLEKEYLTAEIAEITEKEF